MSRLTRIVTTATATATAAMLLMLLTSSGCESEHANDASETAGESGGKPVVVCTIAMIADITRNVGGDLIEVEGIIGEGIDPHTYSASRDDVIALRNADIVFYNGLLLEGRMIDMLVSMASRGTTVRAVSENYQTDAVLRDEADHDDPHLWMDVQAWMHATNVVAETLAAFDEDGAAEYRANATAYLEQLEALDDYARSSLASVPEARRVLVTAHDAFNYMARAYDLEVRGIQGISTESEAGVRDINELIEFIVDRKIAAVFVESSVSTKNVQALVEGARARNHDIRIGGELFSDAMGPAGTYEGTYIGMIDHNVTIITRALGGTAPDRGMQGKLSTSNEHAQPESH